MYLTCWLTPEVADCCAALFEEASVIIPLVNNVSDGLLLLLRPVLSFVPLWSMLRQIINSCFCTSLSPRGRKTCVFPSLFPSFYPSPGSPALWFCVALGDGDPSERLAINSKMAFKLYSFALCWGSRLFHSGALNSWFIGEHNLGYTLQWSWSPPDKLQPDGTVLWGCLCFVPINCGKAFCVQGSPRIPVTA